MKFSTAVLIFVFLIAAVFTFTYIVLNGKIVTQPPKPFSVEYIVDGGAPRADLTYQNASGSSEQHSAVQLPFHLTFNAQEGQFLYVSAQNAGRLGSVSCHILIDGVEQKSATSDGAYVIATCSGRFKR